MTPADILAHCRTTASGARRYLSPQPAGYIASARCRESGWIVCYRNIMREDLGLVVRTTVDDNGVNLFIVYADGQREQRNVNPRMNLFVCWSGTDPDLQGDTSEQMLAAIDALAAQEA